MYNPRKIEMSMKPNKNRNKNTKLTNGGKEIPFPKVGIATKKRIVT